MRPKYMILFLFIEAICFRYGITQEIFPKDSWQEISNPEEAGWSLEKLEEAQRIADKIGSDAVLIIYRGAILKAWGEIERKFMCHSMRKSLLSAIIGVHADQANIDLNRSLADIGIDDVQHPLTEIEKTATIKDLLSSRSGIYLPAAYEWPTRKPQRGKFSPGENWFYPNNWDYNALLSCYEKLTDNKIFEDFNSSFAIPLQMEDFEVSDGYYHYERHKSSHPAYPFRMSARDLARIGLLFLRKGQWGDKQILSSEWIEKSTSPISQTYAEGEGYGYLWWVDQKNFKYDYYSAEGTGGHGLIVVPEIELIIVHRTNTYTDKRISFRERGRLISKIMEAYIEYKPLNEFELRDYSAPKVPSVQYSSEQIDKSSYQGVYNIEKLNDYESDTVSIGINQKGELEVFIPYKGYFSILPINRSLFLLEDSNEYISFILNEDGLAEKLVYHRNSRMGQKIGN